MQSKAKQSTRMKPIQNFCASNMAGGRSSASYSHIINLETTSRSIDQFHSLLTLCGISSSTLCFNEVMVGRSIFRNK
jgi:uncharacterized protein YuzB (UPF0349 family)